MNRNLSMNNFDQNPRASVSNFLIEKSNKFVTESSAISEVSSIKSEEDLPYQSSGKDKNREILL